MKTRIMKRSVEDRRDALAPGPIQADAYPYGLRVRLEHPELEKLGIGDLPKPGDKYRLAGEFHVTDAGQQASEGGADRHIGGVLHSLGLEPMPGNSTLERPKSIRDEIEAARARTGGRIGARFTDGDDNNG